MDTKQGERQRDLLTALANELATVVGALLGASATAAPADGQGAPGWVVGCSMSGAVTGLITLALNDTDASTLARRLMGLTDEPTQDAVADTIAEVAGQAAGGLGQQAVAGGARIKVNGTPTHGGETPAEPALAFDVTLDDGTALRFSSWAQLEQAQPVRAAEPTPPVVVAPASSGRGEPPPQENLDIILDIELPLTVRFGRTEMSLQALTRVGPGSVIDLDRSPDEPVEVLVNDKVIARGEVVVVAGNYGVRITEVASPVDRIRTMGT